MYEVANEDNRGTMAWQEAVASVIRSTDSSKLVGITVRPDGPGGGNSEVYASSGDYIEPFFYSDSSEIGASSGSRVVVIDTDHMGGGGCPNCSTEFPWMALTRGNHALSLVLDSQGMNEALGRSNYMANTKITDLGAMAPHDWESSTGYCLSDSGNEYLVYAPYAGDVTVSNLTSGSSYSYEWYTETGDPYSPSAIDSGSFTANGSSQGISNPSGGKVLYIKQGSGGGGGAGGGGAGGAGGGDAYLGCYGDSDSRDLPTLAFRGSVTNQNCNVACRDRGFAYAGAEYSEECWCGNSYGSYGSSNDCNMACSGDDSEICGGPWALSVYRTDASPTGGGGGGGGDTTPHSDMSATASSEEPGYEAGRALDDDASTGWHINWDYEKPPMPQSITLGLGGSYSVSKVRYLPFHAGDGHILGYRIYTSTNGGRTFNQQASGTWADGSSELSVSFAAVPNTTHVRLEATSAVNGWAGAAEINVER